MTDFKTFSLDDLRAFIAEAEDELESRKLANDPKRVSVPYCAYNKRRYGTPWIARVTAWPVGGKPTLEFGSFCGNDGLGGEVEILARVGDIVRDGQKDFRGGNTENNWRVVETGYSLRPIDQSEARKLFKA